MKTPQPVLPHIVRKPGKMFKKSQKFNVMDLIENNMGGP